HDDFQKRIAADSCAAAVGDGNVVGAIIGAGCGGDGENETVGADIVGFVLDPLIREWTKAGGSNTELDGSADVGGEADRLSHNHRRVDGIDDLVEPGGVLAGAAA